MKKSIGILIVMILLTNISILTAGAEELTFDYSGVYNQLSDETVQRLQAMGVNAADAASLSGLRMEDVTAVLSGMAESSLQTPLKGLLTVLASLILCAMLSAYQTGLSNDSRATVHTAASLAVSAAVAAPALGFIGAAGGVIANAADLFLAYIPVAAAMMAASGHAASALAAHGPMIAAGQGVARVCADVIVPLMHVFLGLSVTAGVAPESRLQGITAMLSKLGKWLLAFVMSVFTAVLSLRGMAAGAVDSVASRTAKFALSSCVPIVGGALSEAYKTVQSSLHLLKSGLGIFVILAIALTFLPSVLQCIAWSLCLFVGKAAAEVMGVDGCARLLDSLGSVFSLMLAVLLCVMAAFIIATAAVFTIGGESA